jgi:hypothetical protein
MIDFGEVVKVARDVGLKRYYLEHESADLFESISKSLLYVQAVTC